MPNGSLKCIVPLGEDRGKKYEGELFLSSPGKISLRIVSSKDNKKSPPKSEYKIPSTILYNICELLPQYYAFIDEKNKFPSEQKFIIFPLPKNNYTDLENEKSVNLLINTMSRSPQFFKEFIDSSLEIPDAITNLINIKRNTLAVKKFEEMLSSCHKESEWKILFHQYPWLLGLGCSTLDMWEIDKEQFNIRPAPTRCEKTNRGDYLLVSRGDLKFTAILDIKTPQAELLKKVPIKAGIYSTTQSLNDSIAQLRMYRQRLQVEQHANSKDKKFTIDPKAFLIVGQLKEFFGNDNKVDAFQLFRRNQKDVEIYTYDELLRSAQGRLNLQRKDIESSKDK